MIGRLAGAPLRLRLIEQHLHELETLEGVFPIGPDQALGVTSERIIIVTGEGSRGWALSSIPTHLITDVILEPSTEQAGAAVRVSYAAPSPRRLRNGDATQVTDTLALCPEVDTDAQRVFDLVSACLARGVASDATCTDTAPADVAGRAQPGAGKPRE